MNQTPKTEADRRTGTGRRSGFDRRSGVERRASPPREVERLLDRNLMPDKASQRQEAMLINEITLVLAEKRTSLSVMRTGLAVMALPLSVLSVLIVISRYYDPAKVMYLLGPLLGICAGLTILGVYLILSAVRRIRALNLVITVLKGQNSQLRELSQAMREGRSQGDDVPAPPPSQPLSPPPGPG